MDRGAGRRRQGEFAYFPVAVLRGLDNFTNGTISMKFTTIAGDADRTSGILFNVKPNGDWLAVRYNDTENNVAFWEFHNGVRRNIRFSDRAHKFMLDRAAWHDLKLTVEGAEIRVHLDGELVPHVSNDVRSLHALISRNSRLLVAMANLIPALLSGRGVDVQYDLHDRMAVP